jgi:DNA-binding LacI/PurR family transcriptional regulator
MQAEAGRRYPAPDVLAPRVAAPRPPTMKDVAAAAGVSKALVSLVFRDAPGASAGTRARVFEAAMRIGYRTNRTASLLARRRNKLLGVSMVVRNAFHAELVEDIQAAADANGYEIVLSPVTRTHSESRAIEALLEFRCEALLLLGPDCPAAELTAFSAQAPVVVIGRRVPLTVLDVVRTADDDGLGLVVDHLVGLDHRRITHARGGDGAIAADRCSGYRQAMAACGLEQYVDVIEGGATEEAGRLAAEELLARDSLPTAVAAFNDRCAIGLLDRLTRAGVDVPGTVSVVGYDDSPVSRLAHINLTTVSQEPGEQARLAVAAAVERLDSGRTAPRESVLPPRLVVRGSTGPARHE